MFVRLHFENAFLAAGFGIQPANKSTVVEDGQREIAVLAFGCRRVALDGEIEIEELARLFSVLLLLKNNKTLDNIYSVHYHKI